jgi:hypothetical protein
MGRRDEVQVRPNGVSKCYKGNNDKANASPQGALQTTANKGISKQLFNKYTPTLFTSHKPSRLIGTRIHYIMCKKLAFYLILYGPVLKDSSLLKSKKL